MARARARGRVVAARRSLGEGRHDRASAARLRGPARRRPLRALQRHRGALRAHARRPPPGARRHRLRGRPRGVRHARRRRGLPRLPRSHRALPRVQRPADPSHLALMRRRRESTRRAALTGAVARPRADACCDADACADRGDAARAFEWVLGRTGDARRRPWRDALRGRGARGARATSSCAGVIVRRRGARRALRSAHSARRVAHGAPCRATR